MIGTSLYRVRGLAVAVQVVGEDLSFVADIEDLAIPRQRDACRNREQEDDCSEHRMALDWPAISACFVWAFQRLICSSRRPALCLESQHAIVRVRLEA